MPSVVNKTSEKDKVLDLSFFLQSNMKNIACVTEIYVVDCMYNVQVEYLNFILFITE